jgi:catechol 2,3-dioxygenase-like lactoylglutathione lyase family enzyme
MLSADRLGYLFLNVADIERSTDFFVKACHMEVSERKDGRIYLRGGLNHHWLVLQQTDRPGLERVGIEVADRPTLDAFEEQLRSKGILYEAGDGLESDRVLRYLRFSDPSGNPLELYTDMVSMPSPPKPKLVSFLDIQHIVLSVHDFEAAHDFYTNVLGMVVSDYFEQTTAFMHFRNGWHHGIGISSGSGRTNGLNHVCFQPDDLDITMRARAAVKKLGLKITSDLLKHGPSGSIGFYFQGPDTVVEFSYGARNYAENEVFKPRILPRSVGVDVWQHGLEDLELARPLQEALAQTT